MVAAGIDPGTNGAMVIFRDPIESYIFPKVGGKIDWKAYSSLFDKLDGCFVVMEEVHAVFGSAAKSTFMFGGMFYSAIVLLHKMNIQYELVPPKKWQNEIWSSSDKVFKTGGKLVDTKKTSLLSAKRLFPHFDFLYGDNEKITAHHLRTNVHEGIVDAFNIAEYARRKLI